MKRVILGLVLLVLVILAIFVYNARRTNDTDPHFYCTPTEGSLCAGAQQ